MLNFLITAARKEYNNIESPRVRKLYVVGVVLMAPFLLAYGVAMRVKNLIKSLLGK